ncbi:conserved hypothetical protein [Ricinus communis]|uniref:Uncharacterized protein n=1 Tax=Ricinus communis TaxID=3988 RepID=B9SC15_RICCO|nr:conserved hypothetical protein [Ricinus communis]
MANGPTRHTGRLQFQKYIKNPTWKGRKRKPFSCKCWYSFKSISIPKTRDSSLQFA